MADADELHAHRFERVRPEIMRLTGYFHTESSAHVSEYLAYFRKTSEMVREYHSAGGTTTRSVVPTIPKRVRGSWWRR